MVVNVYEYTNAALTIHGYYGCIVADGIGICTQTKTMTDQSLRSRLRRQDTSKPSTKPIQKGIKQLNKNAIELWWVSELMLPNRSCFELFWVHEWIPGSVAKTRPNLHKASNRGSLQTLIVVSFIPNFDLLRTGVTSWKTPWFVSTRNSRVKRLTNQCLMKHEAEIKLTTSWANCSNPNSSFPWNPAWSIWVLIEQLGLGNRYAAGITSLY